MKGTGCSSEILNKASKGNQKDIISKRFKTMAVLLRMTTAYSIVSKIPYLLVEALATVKIALVTHLLQVFN